MKLPNGTAVTVEGDPDEIRRIIEFYGGNPGTRSERGTARGEARPKPAPAPSEDEDVDRVSLVVNEIKSSDSAVQIEEKILDQKSQLNRILLPIFIVHEQLGNGFGLTSGEIAKITRELGVPVGQPDVSKILAGDASRFVLGDRTRVKGKAVRYKLSRRGVQHVAALLGSPSAP